MRSIIVKLDWRIRWCRDRLSTKKSWIMQDIQTIFPLTKRNTTMWMSHFKP